MKKLFFFVAFVAILASCQNQKALTIAEDEKAADDSTSYELVVLDPGFDTWFFTRAQPANFYSQEYYENWNRRYVSAWNYEKIGYKYSRVIHGNIDYDPSVDYGLDLNYKLFYYFLYVENELGIKLLPDGPRVFH